MAHGADRGLLFNMPASGRRNWGLRFRRVPGRFAGVSRKAWWASIVWVVIWGGMGIQALGTDLPVPGPRPDPFAAMHAIEMPWIHAVQSLEGLGQFMSWLSDLGPGKPMFILIGVLYLFVDARLATRLAMLMLLVLGFRELLAMVLQSPRPYWFGDAIRTFREPPLSTPTFGLPSGHAMASTAFWFFLAGEVRRRWVWAMSGVIVFGVCYSRVYLGVHFPSDVSLGVVLGALSLAAFRRWEKSVGAHWRAWTVGQRMAGAAGLALGLAALTFLTWAWISRAVPSDVWPPFGARARSCVGFGWTTGALAGWALACASPSGWTGVGDSRELRLKRLALAAVGGLGCFLLPLNWNFRTGLSEEAGGMLLGLRFTAGALLAWAGLFLIPRALIRLKLTGNPAELPPGSSRDLG